MTWGDPRCSFEGTDPDRRQSLIQCALERGHAGGHRKYGVFNWTPGEWEKFWANTKADA